MTVKVTRPPINLREKLNEIDKISLENFKAMDATFSGNVSIGKNVPTSYLTSVKLNIHGSNFTYVRVSNDGYTGLDIGQADASEGGAGLIKLRDNTPLVFYTADLERMRIDASGNVNIYGTDNRPLAITSFNTASAGAGWDLDATSINGVVTVSTGGAERMRIDSVGTTTIKTNGTTQLVLNRADASIQNGNQIANLLITGDDPSAGQSGAAINFTAGDEWTTNYYPTNIVFYNDSSGTLTPRMTIDASGNVGINVVSPADTFGGSGTLDAGGPLLSRGALGQDQTNAGVLQYLSNVTTIRSYGATAGSGSIAFNTGGGGVSDIERLRIDQDGGLVIKSVGGATTAGFYGGNLVNGITAVPSASGTPFVLGRDTGTLRSAHFGGNLKFDSGYGVTFSVAGGTGTFTSGTLDDYEEGTWLPEIYYQNVTDQAAATDVIQTGTYTKVGNIVHVSFRLEWTAGTGLTTDNIGVKNLPFVGASNHYNSVGTFFGTYTGSDSPSLGSINAGGSLALVLDVANNGNLGPAFGTGSGRYIRGSMTYLAS